MWPAGKLADIEKRLRALENTVNGELKMFDRDVPGLKQHVNDLREVLYDRCNCCEKAYETFYGKSYVKLPKSKYRCETCAKNTRGKRR